MMGGRGDRSHHPRRFSGKRRKIAAAVPLVIFGVGHWTGGWANIVIALVLGGLLAAFFVWASKVVTRLSAKSELAEAFRYTLKRQDALSRFLTDARLEIDNNIAENAMRGIALGRKNYLFAGSNAGGERAAAIYTIVQTAKLNERNPELTNPLI